MHTLTLVLYGQSKVKDFVDERNIYKNLYFRLNGSSISFSLVSAKMAICVDDKR